MITCSKTYSEIPFAHRQHRHPGHCSLIHGHNWTLTITFACDHFDSNGFVVDFGNLKYIKQWLADHLDHACLLAIDDPLKDQIVSSVPQVYKLYEVENASCEGIALHLWEVFSELLHGEEGERVWISQIDLQEDARNATRFVPTPNELKVMQDHLASKKVTPEPAPEKQTSTAKALV